MIAFDLVERAEDGEHTFAVYGCRADGDGDLVAELARVIRDLYVDAEHLRDVLTAAMNDAATVADGTGIEAAIHRVLTAAIPEPGKNAIPQLDVARNELAEALAYVALAEVHGTVIPAHRIRHKEVPHQPSRGRDLVGLEDGPPLVAVIGEVKASDEAASPPGVVGAGDSSLRGQLEGFLAVRDDALLAELNWALKHGGPEHESLIAQAILAHAAGALALCAAPVLVRPADVRGADDFGTFRDDPGQFAPARVRFSVLVVDRGLNELAQAVYEEARR